VNNLIAELIAVLTEQLILYEQVRDLAKEERLALISGKPDDVLLLVRRKETLLLKIRTLDESRQIICLRLAKRSDALTPSFTLAELAARAVGEQADQLRDLRDRLSECAEELRVLNETNAAICHNGIDTVRQIVEALSQAPPGEGTAAGYGKPGSRPRAAANGATTTMHVST
jgi:flagellar biosynthesis/type III secretory pathway chaperone